MSSSDEDGLPDQRLSFDLSRGPQRPHTSPEDAELRELRGHASVETLCLRRTDLTDIEGSIVKNSVLKVSLVRAFVKTHCLGTGLHGNVVFEAGGE